MVVHMNAGVSIMVRGSLVAEGTETNRITFTSKPGTQTGVYVCVCAYLICEDGRRFRFQIFT